MLICENAENIDADRLNSASREPLVE